MNTLETAYIFDVDGTLVSTEENIARLIVEIIEKHGVTIYAEDYHRQFAGTSFEDALSFYKQAYGLDLDVEESITYLKEQIDINIETDGIKSTPGTIQWFKQTCKQAIQAAIASNAPRAVIETNLVYSNLISYTREFPVFSAYDFNAWKPDPTIFIQAFKSFNQTNLKRVVVVEDSLAGLLAIDEFQKWLSEESPCIEVVATLFCSNSNDHLTTLHTGPMINDMRQLSQI